VELRSGNQFIKAELLEAGSTVVKFKVPELPGHAGDCYPVRLTNLETKTSSLDENAQKQNQFYRKSKYPAQSCPSLRSSAFPTEP